MASITSTGIGSNLDIDGIIKQLMKAEGEKPLAVLDKKEAGFLAKISAVGSLKSVIASLQSAANDLVPPSGTTPFDKFNTYKASVSNTDIANVKTTASAIAGTYSLEVTHLAQEHRIATVPATNASSPFGQDGKLKGDGGTLTITLGTADKSEINKTTSLSIEAGATPEEIRDAINAARAGVSATVINGKNGKQLALVGNEVGSNQVIKLSGIPELAFDNGGSGFTEPQLASGSKFMLNGIEVESKTNTVTDAIDGITLELLKKSEANAATTITISNDASSLNSAIESFVKAYNEFNSQANSMGSYNQATKTAGVLNGDSGLRMSQNLLRATVSNVPAELADARKKTLSEIGITMQKDGSLAIDKSKLASVIKFDLEDTANLVAAYGKSFKAATEGLIGSKGALDAKIDGFNSLVSMVKQQRVALNTRLVGIEVRYRKQFSALDIMMSKMTQTSNFLTTELGKLDKMTSGK